MRSRKVPIEIGLKRRFLAECDHPEDKSTDRCWLWKGKMTGDYGAMSIAGSTFQAHRVSYALYRGQPRTDMVVDHRCRNKACVNPDHLEQVTVAENARRYLGAAKTKDDKSRTLDDAKVLQIKKRLRDGDDPKEIAAAFGITVKHLGKIRRGTSWGHVVLGDE